MAVGDPLFYITPLSRCGPITNVAGLDALEGTGNPIESLPVLAFDSSGIEHADFNVALPHNYGGGGLMFSLQWTPRISTSGDVIWGLAIRRQDTAEDYDTTAHTYDYNEIGVTAPNASGLFVYNTIIFASGVDMDNWYPGESANIRLRRNASNAIDTMPGDALFVSLYCRESGIFAPEDPGGGAP